MESAKNKLQDFLKSRGKKAPEAVFDAKRRIAILNTELATEKARVASLAKEYQAAERLLEFANELHGFCEITLEEVPEK